MQKESGYLVVTRNLSSWGGKATTAFITVRTDGIQLSDEVKVTGADETSIKYNTAGNDYIGNVCVRANATAFVHALTTTCQGVYYPDGK